MSPSITLDFAGPAARRTAARGPVVLQLHDSLWRVTRADGDVLGYIERLDAPSGDRFRAKRFLPRQRRFLIDGEFWSMDDAVACFPAA